MLLGELGRRSGALEPVRPAALVGARPAALDLDEPAARERFEDALGALATEAEGLASVASALARLRAQPDLAWRCYAGALLAAAIGDEE